MTAESCYVIAEAGVNHDGSLGRARELVDVAAIAGADAVKFQTFRADELVTRTARKAAYQQETTDPAESQHGMLQALELGPSDHRALVEHCGRRGIQFLSTPFDIASLRFLAGELRVPRLKIPSGEVTNGPLLLEAARSGLPVIMSTGMSTLTEVEQALSVLAFGYATDGPRPDPAALEAAYASDQGQDALRQHVTLLHCTSEYPTPPEDVHLRAMDTLRAAFGLPVGYSDHTRGLAVPIAAVARGAAVLEKHFTLDRSLPGPDHRASLEPDELADLVSAVRELPEALGRSVKAPTTAELDTRTAARKSLVALKPIAAGETLTEENLGVRRPGSGISPVHYWSYLGRPADRAYEADEPLQ